MLSATEVSQGDQAAAQPHHTVRGWAWGAHRERRIIAVVQCLREMKRTVLYHISFRKSVRVGAHAYHTILVQCLYDNNFHSKSQKAIVGTNFLSFPTFAHISKQKYQ